MGNETISDKETFIKLVLSNIEYNSSTPERARQYLESEGLDVQEILSSGMDRINAIRNRIANAGAAVVGATESYWKHTSVQRLIDESGNDDPVDAIKTRARDMVLHAFELGWQGPPFSPIDLANYLNFDIIPNDTVFDACIVPKKQKFQIQYNPYQRKTRINFSIAHEIAHTLFSDCAQAVRNREENPIENRQLEQLCNAAAAEIQLPYAIFSGDANSAEPSMKGLTELATRYGASLESVFIRYTEVVDKPCAILIGIFQNDDTIVIDYHKSSRSFPVRLPHNVIIPKNSNAYECTSPGWTASDRNVQWDILGDGEFYISSIGISSYRRDNKPRVGILVVPSSLTDLNPDAGKISLEFGDATKPRGKGKKIIAQVVNTSGAIGFGFGKSLSQNYPVVKKALEKWKAIKSEFVLGNVNLVEVNSDLFVFQMLAQKGIHARGSEIPLRYNELRKCLIELRDTALELGCSIHMPAIGAGQAGGDWDIIIGMIHDELVNHSLQVNIYLFPGSKISQKRSANLVHFKEDSTWGNEKLF